MSIDNNSLRVSICISASNLMYNIISYHLRMARRDSKTIIIFITMVPAPVMR